MAIIKVDVAGLQKNRDALARRETELRELISRLCAILDRIDASWEGNASTAYIRMMRNYVDKAAAVAEVVKGHKVYIGDAAEQFSATDSRCATAIRNSF